MRRKEMRMQIANKTLAVALVFTVLATTLLIYFLSDKRKYGPILNDGKRWRIGYYEGGPYKDYHTVLVKTLEGLEHLGWLPEVVFPKFKSNDDTKEVWDFLATLRCEYVEFVHEAYWSADWYEEKRAKNRLGAIVYLQQQKLDLVIASGTWAGLDLAVYSHNVPTLVISASDPVESGIITSAEDSGKDHVHAACDPERYEKQVRAFHNIIRFKRLGVVYEDSEVGRTYAALSSVLKVSIEAGFDVISCIASDEDIPEIESMQGVLKCHEELALAEVDAVYITAHRGVNPKWMPGVLEPLFRHKIPTLGQEGVDQVRNGVLISIAAAVKMEDTGLFHAEVITKSFHGIKLRDISQIFDEEKRIVINTKAAEMIGYTFDKSIIEVADIIFESIGND